MDLQVQLKTVGIYPFNANIFTSNAPIAMITGDVR